MASLTDSLGASGSASGIRSEVERYVRTFQNRQSDRTLTTLRHAEFGRADIKVFGFVSTLPKFCKEIVPDIARCASPHRDYVFDHHQLWLELVYKGERLSEQALVSYPRLFARISEITLNEFGERLTRSADRKQ